MTDTREENSFGADIETVVNLMTGRCAGAVNDDNVEDAINKLLSRSIPPSTSVTSGDDHYKSSFSAVMLLRKVPYENRPHIVRDMGCYDVDGDEFQHETPCMNSSTSALPTTTVEQLLTENLKKCEVNWDEIPLGQIGCRLMQTFGDGPNPRADTVSSALLGTRQLVHMAIKDARALRRKMKISFLRARSQVTGRDQVKIHRIKRSSSTLKTFTEQDEKNTHIPTAVDAELLFQAFGGISKLSFDPPCGFDEDQLERLFPEEMYAYRRWKTMHKAATEISNSHVLEKKQMLKGSSEDTSAIDGDFSASVDDPDVGYDDDDGAEAESNTTDPKEWGGYLQGRLSQFDARTEQMKDDFYIKFSEVRRGSFLAPSCLNQDEKLWEKLRKADRPRGRLNYSLVTWESLPAQHVPFLHWLGFSPRSALPLPSEATTNALAFLAYDFFGKIVEKAIFLRCLQEGDTRHRKTTSDGRLILELQAEEQLSHEDIHNALNDSTLASKPLYRSYGEVGTSHEAAQLYFGPGFEDRLEVELDQILLKKIHDKEVSQDEKNIRIQEDNFFENLQISQPVKLNSIMTLRTDGIGPQQSITSKRALNTDLSLSEKRPRGRPRKQVPIAKDIEASEDIMKTGLDAVECTETMS